MSVFSGGRSLKSLGDASDMVIIRYATVYGYHVRLIVKPLAQHCVTLNNHSKAVHLLGGVLYSKVHSEHEMPSPH